MNLHLLLADDSGPALPDGLDARLLDQAAGPERMREARYLYAEDGTNDLAAQRWAVVYPAARPELLDAIGPLIARREAQQGAPVLRFPVGETDDGVTLFQKLYDGGPDDVKREDSPRYVLVLGDLDEVALALQHRLATVGVVGRLAFDRAEDYRAYADKVLRFEDGAALPPRLILYGTYDQNEHGALMSAERELLAPIADLSPGLDLQSFGRLNQSAADGLRALTATAADPRPGVLLTVSHGLGSRSWSVAERRARQGALRIDADTTFDAEQVRDGPFLPGGLWAMFACFGAGTPTESRYDHWLRDLVAVGVFGRVNDVLSTLSPDRPFVAALPKAALANPQGPLGVLGHVDLAWGWNYSDVGGGGTSRARRFGDLLASVARGDRFGLGMGPIGQAQRGAAQRLLELTDAQQQRALTDEERRKRGHNWMTWQDLGAWILLGDPAARLPGAVAKAVSKPQTPALRPASTPDLPFVSTPEIETPEIVALETLILARLAGEADARARAEAAGIGWAELRALEQIYTEAGRRALALARR